MEPSRRLAFASVLDAPGWCGRATSEVRGVRGENAGKTGGSTVIEHFGAFTFHRERRQLFRDGAEVHLTPKAFDLLALLIEREPAVVPKADVHARLWPGTFVSDATLAGLVKELRRALGNDGSGVVIRTAHRVGFAFESVRTASPEARSAPDLTHWLAVGTRKIPHGRART